MRFSIPERPTLAAGLREVASLLAGGGHGAWLAGEELATAWWAPPGPGARSHRLLTTASSAEVLALLPRAVVTHPRAFALPSPDGPIDLLVERRMPDALGDFGFTLHAVAWDLAEDAVLDPHHGLADARDGLLRTTADPADLLEHAPVLALRALRLVAELGLTAEPRLEAALGSVRFTPTSSLRAAARSELPRMLCGPHAGRALELAAETGLAKNLAPTADPSAARWIDAVPSRPELRFAVWLGRGAAGWLRSWRFGLRRSQLILELAERHPIDEAASPRRDASVARLLRRVGADDRADLFAAREAQLASGALPEQAVRQGRAGLEALRSAIERVERNRSRAEARSVLALTGKQVMEQLGCGPGRRVGQALGHLADWIAGDAERNTEARLRVALEQWAQTRDGV